MSRRISEHDEFLLSQLLDGDLIEAEARALRERLEREPALRSAFDQMRRLDEALKHRQADQPAVDWDRFHRRVMDAVEAEDRTSAGTIRFPSWLRVAAPLAAAAAIALVVTFYRSPEQSIKQDEPPGPVAAIDKPDTPAPDRILVQFSRPKAVADKGEAKIQVRFKRNDQLGDTIARRDKDRADAPTIVVAKALREKETAEVIDYLPL